MRILFLGDIFGRPGRQAVKKWLPEYRQRDGIDFVIANGENTAGGKGLTHSIAHQLFDSGVDVLTGGNHSFQQKESYSLYEDDPRVLRPANMPPGTPGHGLGLYATPHHAQVAVINLIGRAFMKPVDCPFRMARSLVEVAREQAEVIIVDMHAEATSEKMAMAAHLDGQVAAVLGTHTHVPTADARILPGGTAAMTDVGMCGPYDSVIGVATEIVLRQLIVGLPVRHEVATDDVRISGVVVGVNPNTGLADSIRPVFHPRWHRGTESD